MTAPTGFVSIRGIVHQRSVLLGLKNLKARSKLSSSMSERILSLCDLICLYALGTTTQSNLLDPLPLPASAFPVPNGPSSPSLPSDAKALFKRSLTVDKKYFDKGVNRSRIRNCCWTTNQVERDLKKIDIAQSKELRMCAPYRLLDMVAGRGRRKRELRYGESNPELPRERRQC